MSYRLFLAPVNETGEDILYDWVLEDENLQVAQEGFASSKFDIEDCLEKRSEKVWVIGVVPSSKGTFCQATIPSGRHAEKALPYAIEEQLAQDIDTLHLATQKQNGGVYNVWALDETLMATWASRFSSFKGTDLFGLYFDSDLLVAEGSNVKALMRNGNVTIKAETAPLTIKDQDLSLLQHLLPENSKEKPLILYGTNQDITRCLNDFSKKTTEPNGEFKIESVEIDSPLRFLVEGFHKREHSPMNLCQGKYAISSKSGSPVRSVAFKGVLAFAVMINVGLYMGMGWYHEKQVDRLDQSSMDIYKSIYPNEKAVTANNLKRVVQGKLKHANQGAGRLEFVEAMKVLGQGLKETPGAFVESIHYNQRSGSLVVEINARRYEQINTLQQKITKQGFAVKAGSVSQKSGVALAKLTLSKGGEW